MIINDYNKDVLAFYLINNQQFILDCDSYQGDTFLSSAILSTGAFSGYINRDIFYYDAGNDIYVAKVPILLKVQFITRVKGSLPSNTLFTANVNITRTAHISVRYDNTAINNSSFTQFNSTTESKDILIMPNQTIGFTTNTQGDYITFDNNPKLNIFSAWAKILGMPNDFLKL